MMDDNAFDELLKGAERNAPGDYNVDQEWETVASTLFPARRRNPIWIWLGIGFSIILLIALAFYNSPNPLLGAFPFPMAAQSASVYATTHQTTNLGKSSNQRETTTQNQSSEIEIPSQQIASTPPSSSSQVTRHQTTVSSTPSLLIIPEYSRNERTVLNERTKFRKASSEDTIIENIENNIDGSELSNSTTSSPLTSIGRYLVTNAIQMIPLDSVFSENTEEVQPLNLAIPTRADQKEQTWAFTTHTSFSALNPLTSGNPDEQAWKPLNAWNSGLGVHYTKNNWTFSGGLHYLRRTHRLRLDIANSLADDLQSSGTFNPIITSEQFENSSSNRFSAATSLSGNGTEEAIGLSLGVSRPIYQTRWRWGTEVKYQAFLPGTTTRSRLSNKGLTLSGELAWQPIVKLPMQLYGSAGIDLIRRYPDFGDFSPNRDWQIGAGIRWTW